MAIIPVIIERTFEVAASCHDTYSLLADIRRSASHVPEVQDLEELDERTWRWIMNEQGYAGLTMKPVYVCRYGFQRDDLRITWGPVEEEKSFMAVHGHWQLEEIDSGTRTCLLMDMQFDLPVPQMLVNLAQPFLAGELEKQMDHYVNGLTQALGSLNHRV